MIFYFYPSINTKMKAQLALPLIPKLTYHNFFENFAISIFQNEKQ